MGSFKLEQFGGMLPAWDEHLLPASQAALSQNAYLFSGALVGWRLPVYLRTLTSETARYAYRVPEVTSATATAQLRFLANPGQGDAFVIGEFTYTFTATVTNPYDILIGGSKLASATNALAAINIGAGVGVAYGTGTCPNPELSTVPYANRIEIVGSDPVIYLVAIDEGAAFNSIAISSTNHSTIDWYDIGINTGGEVRFDGGVNKTFDAAITGNGVWLEYYDPDTTVMRSSVVDDKFQRYYISSPSLPPKYNTYDRIQAGLPEWMLGLNPPGCAPGVSVTGGGDAVQAGLPGTATDKAAVGGNAVYMFPYTPDGAMELNDVAFMPGETHETARFAAVLYDDNAGVPYQLMNVGSVVTGCTADTQITSQFQNPTGLLANVKYWIGIMLDTSTLIYQSPLTTGSSMWFTNTFSNGPSVFAGTSHATPDLQMWADLTINSILAARTYVYTWVSEYGEESPPSPYTLVNGWSNGVWKITLWTPPPDDMGVLRNIKKLRLYRTQLASTGQTVYVFVKELDIGTLEYTDVDPDNIVALNRILPSATWFPPPEGLRGIVSLPNGMACGFRSNELWFCEPYQPHAWPAAYVVTTEFPIVGLGTTGQSVVVCTAGKPYVATGVSPASMTLQKCDKSEPCVSRGSIVSNDDGVYYISPNGLILVTQYGKVTNTTDGWVTREKWRQLTPAAKQRAVLLASSYFCIKCRDPGDVTDDKQGFVLELDPSDANSFTIWPQPGGHRIGFSKLTEPTTDDVRVDNVLIDPWSGMGYLITGGVIRYYDFGDTAPYLQTYKWKSKTYQQTSAKNFEAMRFYFTVPPNTPAQNADRNEDDTADTSWQTLDTGQYGIVRVSAVDGDGVLQLVTTREIRTSGEVLRILSGFKSEEWVFEIEGRVRISNMQVATTIKELGLV